MKIDETSNMENMQDDVEFGYEDDDDEVVNAEDFG